MLLFFPEIKMFFKKAQKLDYKPPQINVPTTINLCDLIRASTSCFLKQFFDF